MRIANLFYNADTFPPFLIFLSISDFLGEMSEVWQKNTDTDIIQKMMSQD